MEWKPNGTMRLQPFELIQQESGIQVQYRYDWHIGAMPERYADSKTLEEYGQRRRNCNLEDIDMDSWRRISEALGIPNGEPLAPVLERFRKATQRQPLYQCIFHEDDGSLTESYGLMFE